MESMSLEVWINVMLKRKLSKMEINLIKILKKPSKDKSPADPIDNHIQGKKASLIIIDEVIQK